MDHWKAQATWLLLVESVAKWEWKWRFPIFSDSKMTLSGSLPDRVVLQPDQRILYF